MRGFTVIDLLVSVAIVATVIAVLAPSLAAARASAKEIQCKSNVRQNAAVWLANVEASRWRSMGDIEDYVRMCPAGKVYEQEHDTGYGFMPCFPSLRIQAQDVTLYRGAWPVCWDGYGWHGGKATLARMDGSVSMFDPVEGF